MRDNRVPDADNRVPDADNRVPDAVVTGHVDATRPCTVIVCDDRQELRQAVLMALAPSPAFDVVGEAADGDGCLELVRHTRPDVLILDVGMPGGGPGLVTALKAMHPGLYVLVFSGRQERRLQDRMLSAGADQYLVKTGRLRPLLQALERVAIVKPVL